MLDQLVESKSHMNEDKRRSGFMLTILVIAVAGVATAWGVDLFGKDFGVGDDDLALTTLVAPVPVPDEEPPPPEEQKPEKQQVAADVRKELIASIDMSPKEPPPISVAKMNKATVRPEYNVVLGDRDANASVKAESGRGTVVESGGPTGLSGGDAAPPAETGAPPPPPPPVKKEVPKMISKGVLNGSAVSLPKPAYPPMARQNGVKGSVNVQVVISETGSVISASAVSGHALLKPAAVAAARGARFSPTLLSGQPVKVSGVITYNFN